MRKRVIAVILVLGLALSGCAGMTPTQQRTLSGGAIGAAGGAVIGALAGDAGVGAAIGGAVGLAGGYLYGKHKEAKERAFVEGYQAGQSRP
jgi:hypothetical protein